MSKNRYLIFGSCVTRDVFSFFPENLNVVDYFSRSSLISVVGNPLNIKEEEIHLSSKFQRKEVLRDCNKTFFDELKQKDFDFLVIDLIDERFDLLCYNNIYITRSDELVDSGLEDQYSFQRLARSDKKTHSLWMNACQQFVKRLCSIVPAEKIILHKAFWADHYIDQEHARKFNLIKMVKIRKNNKLLEQYYTDLEELIPGMRIIQIPTFYSDANHKWGISPFHYTLPYYESVYSQLVSFDL